MRIGIYPYGPSESAAVLRDEINSKFENNPARILLRDGRSRFRANTEDKVINWGSRSSHVNEAVSNGVLLNSVQAVTNAALKDKTSELISDLMVESTTDKIVANMWLGDGCGVFARTELNGHSGSGIVYCCGCEPEYLGNVEYSEDIVDAPLYTKAILDTNRKEYRLHVFKGQVIAIQQKRRRNGWRENEDFSDVVRNHGNGWVFATSNIEPSQEMLRTAVLAVEGLMLDFGAVDLVESYDKCFVYEVNTAPGLDSDTTKEAYTKAFVEFFNDDPISSPYSIDFEETSSPVTASDVEDQLVSRDVDFTPPQSSYLYSEQEVVPDFIEEDPEFTYQEFLTLNLSVLISQVSDVIGNDNALKELYKAYVFRRRNGESRTTALSNCSLMVAFSWRNTPQGREFWRDIRRGNKPVEYQDTSNDSGLTVIMDEILFSEFKIAYSSETIKKLPDTVDKVLASYALAVNKVSGTNVRYDKDLMFAFDWSTSKQGHIFWKEIFSGNNPDHDVPEEYYLAVVQSSEVETEQPDDMITEQVREDGYYKVKWEEDSQTLIQYWEVNGWLTVGIDIKLTGTPFWVGEKVA